MNRSFVTELASAVVDTVRATVAAAWPRSEVRHEIGRLCEEGRRAGEACEMAFSLSFGDAATVAEATAAVRAAGFAVDATQAARGFLTARTIVRLQPMALARAVTRLERAARPRGGFVAVIGPTRPAPSELAAPVAPVAARGQRQRMAPCT